MSSTASTKGVIGMPAPFSIMAPTFSSGGSTADVFDSFDYFDELANACALTDDEKCRMAVRYVDRETKRLWVTLAGYNSRDYIAFKKGALALYPGGNRGLKYTRRDLKRIVSDPINDGMTTETHLLEYYRRFRPVAVWLIANEKFTALERDQYFWEGLPKRVRGAIARQLEILKKGDYYAGEVMDYEEVVKVGCLVLPDDMSDEDLRYHILGFGDEDARSNGGNNVQKDAEAKRVALDLDVNTKAGRILLEEMKDLERKMHGLDIAGIEYAVFYSRLMSISPGMAQKWATPTPKRLQHTLESVTPKPVEPQSRPRARHRERQKPNARK